MPDTAYRSHEQLSKDMIVEIKRHLTLDEKAEKTVEYAIRKALAQETTACFTTVQNAEDKDVRRVLLRRIDPKTFAFDLSGVRETSRTKTSWWAEWFPGLDTDDLTVRELYSRLPGFTADQVHPMVRLFENPESPIAFKGAITLERHDIIHCLVGRGLLDQDEAFILGYTMGTSKRTGAIEKWAFKKVLQHYPEPYRIIGPELKAYDFGVEAGSRCGTDELYNHPLENYYDLTLAEARRRLGIDKNLLMEFYAREQKEIPRTPASLRLPTATLSLN